MTRRRRTTTATTRRTAAGVVAACLLLAGCSGLEGTGEKGYVSGNGQVTELPPAERGEPVELSGEGLDGGTIDLADLRGEVVVVNVWGAWCTDCREEAPELVEVANAVDADEVSFLGLDLRDPSRANAQAYERTFDVPYPSIYDPSGETILAFRGTIPPRAIPSTVVLDRQGRVAARVLGVLPSAGTLEALIEGVVEEGGSADG